MPNIWTPELLMIKAKAEPLKGVTFNSVLLNICNKTDHSKKYSIRLESGALMIMKGDLQQNLEHRIAKSITPMKPRINLTFRVVI